MLLEMRSDWARPKLLRHASPLHEESVTGRILNEPLVLVQRGFG
jgi:hypothetical protein